MPTLTPKPIAPPPAWTPVEDMAASAHLQSLNRLQRFDPKVWSPIANKAMAGTLSGLGLGYVAHKLMGTKAETPAEKRRKAWRRTFMMGLGGLAGGLFGANTGWKYHAAPHLNQNLYTSLTDPQTAFARGMQQNYHQNMRHAGGKLRDHFTSPGIGMLQNLADSTVAPITSLFHRIGLGNYSPSVALDKMWTLGESPEIMRNRQTARNYAFNPAGALPKAPSEETLRQMYHMVPLKQTVAYIDALKASRDPEALAQLQQAVDTARYHSANLDKSQPWIRDQVQQLTSQL